MPTIPTNAANAVRDLDVNGETHLQGWTFSIVAGNDSLWFTLTNNQIFLKAATYYPARVYKLLISASKAGQTTQTRLITIPIEDAGVKFTEIRTQVVNLPATTTNWAGGYGTSPTEIEFNYYNPGTHDWKVMLLSRALNVSVPTTDTNYPGGGSDDGDPRLAIMQIAGKIYLGGMFSHHNANGNYFTVFEIEAAPTIGWHSVKVVLNTWSAWLDLTAWHDAVQKYYLTYRGSFLTIPTPYMYLDACSDMSAGKQPIISNFSIKISGVDQITEEFSIGVSSSTITGSPIFGAQS